jgi:large conductance mechanosensitive channel
VFFATAAQAIALTNVPQTVVAWRNVAFSFTAFTNIILSVIAAIFGAEVSFNHLTLTLNDTPIPYGAFLTAVVSFLIIAWVLFVLVQAYNRVNAPTEEPKNTKSCEYCQTEIPMNAVRCPNCTSQLVTADS